MAYEGLIGMSFAGVVLIAIVQVILSFMRTLDIVKIKNMLKFELEGKGKKDIVQEVGEVPAPQTVEPQGSDRVIKEIHIPLPKRRKQKKRPIKVVEEVKEEKKEEVKVEPEQEVVAEV